MIQTAMFSDRMSNFTVSARKYRPGTFDTVIGQNHVTQTLKNAIKKGHIGHSFLFCGPRGVGKTTCARILAKALNCENLTTDGEPCGVCNACVSFQNHQSFNIYELDAASNNSVDDIRSLNEQVRFAPQNGRYKIYIIDEVHMLSTAAFNAFLKTLEEPPSYAIFILATTEKHKILPTILSRCQVFDFHRIGVKDTIVHLQEICKQEGVEADEEGLYVIARKADGALRDALSIFDKVASFSGEKISYHDVIENLNVLDYEYYFKCIDNALERDLTSLLLLFDEILVKGFDAHNFLNGLSDHLRNLLLSLDAATIKLMELSEGTQNLYQKQASNTSISYLVSALNILNQFDVQFKSSKNQRLHVELALMKLCFLRDVLNIAELEGTGEKKKPEPKPELKAGPKLSDDSGQPNMAASVAPQNPVKPAPSPAPSPQPVAVVSDEGFSFDLKKIKENVLSAQKAAATAKTEEEVDFFESIDSEVFEKAWPAYLDHIFRKKQVSLHSAIKNIVPRFEGGKVVLSVGTSVVKTMLLKEKQGMVNFMVEKYGLKPFVLELPVEQQSEDESPKFMTDTDKLKYLVSKNEAFKEMVERFDLRIDW